MSKLVCEGCPYYSGVQCHGHGDYWGTCNILEMIQTTLDLRLPKGKYTFDEWLNARSDDQECMFIEKGLLTIHGGVK